MDVTHLMPVGIMLIVTLSGCASECMEALWPSHANWCEML